MALPHHGCCVRQTGENDISGNVVAHPRSKLSCGARVLERAVRGFENPVLLLQGPSTSSVELGSRMWSMH